MELLQVPCTVRGTSPLLFVHSIGNWYLYRTVTSIVLYQYSELGVHISQYPYSVPVYRYIPVHWYSYRYEYRNIYRVSKNGADPSNDTFIIFFQKNRRPASNDIINTAKFLHKKNKSKQEQTVGEKLYTV
jgi:hypothetical protein